MAGVGGLEGAGSTGDTGQPPAAFSSDAPIETAAADALGFAPFADRVATSLRGLQVPEGFVVGLEAEWGMGKTSLVNLVLAAVAAAEAAADGERTRVLRFNPWLFSGQETLAGQYLAELAAQLDKTIGERAGTTLAAFYRRTLRAGEVLGAVAGAGAATLVGQPQMLGPAASLASAGVKGASTFLQGLLGEESVDGIHARLRAKLREAPGRILVVIDDIDRLLPEEMRQILSLVKTFGNLPNVIHLLVYDRDIVDRALSAATGAGPSAARGGATTPTYREKIVQMPLKLPPPRAGGLRELFEGRVSAIAGEALDVRGDRWRSVWERGLADLVRSPRSVVRVANVLAFSWTAVRDEVDAVDYVAIESLRVLEPDLHQRLWDRRLLLLGGASLPEAEARAQLEGILDGVPAARGAALQRLLAMLFPRLARLYAGWLPAESHDALRTRRGVGSAEAFEGYFRFASVAGPLSGASMRALIANLHDRDAVDAAFALARRSGEERESGALAPLMETLAAACRARPGPAADDPYADGTDEGATLPGGPAVPPSPTLVAFLIGEGDALMEPVRPRLSPTLDIDVFDAFDDLLHEAVGALPDDVRPPTVLAGVADARSSLVAGALLWRREAARRGLVGESARPGVRLFDDPHHDALGDAVRARIAASVADGSIARVPCLRLVLDVYAALGQGAAVAALIPVLLEDRDGLVRLVDSNMGFAASGGRTRRSLHAPPGPDALRPGDLRDAALAELRFEPTRLAPCERTLLATFAREWERLYR